MSRLSLGCSLLVLALLVAPASAQDQETSTPSVRVTGSGSVTAAPDMATVRFGIVSRAETAEAARAKNAEAAKSAMNVVRSLDIPEEKMRMETLQLQPRREYDTESKRREERGYEASRQVVVEVSDLDRLPTLVTKVVQGGANRLTGINYGLDDRSAVRNEALQTAARSARDKARLLAQSLDATLGPIREIVEQDVGFDGPRPMAQFAKSAETDAAPEPDAYAAGELEVSAKVRIVFALDES